MLTGETLTLSLSARVVCVCRKSHLHIFCQFTLKAGGPSVCHVQFLAFISSSSLPRIESCGVLLLNITGVVLLLRLKNE